MVEKFKNKLKRFNSRMINSAVKNQTEDYKAVMNATAFLPASFDFLSRLYALDAGLSSVPVCGQCGAYSKIYDRRFTKFCGMGCYSKTVEFRNAIANSDRGSANEKRADTMMAKYGVAFNSQRTDVKPKLGVYQLSETNREYLQSDSLLEDYSSGRSASSIAETRGIYYGTVIDYLRQRDVTIRQTSKTSKQHHRLCDEFARHGIEFLSNDRQSIQPLELDILFPDHNIAVEINGVYWHTEEFGKNSKYHLNKTLECEKKGIQLLQFWHSEIDDKFDLVIDMVLSKLGMCSKVGARETVLVDLEKTDATAFLQFNHLQGGCSFKFAKGLTLNGKLIACAAFGAPRFSKEYDLELIRFCMLKGTSVAGALPKLMKDVRGRIASYANRRWSNGRVYEATGWRRIRTTAPGYSYTLDGQTVLNRMQFQKKKLVNMPGFSDSLSESEIMLNNGYRKLWDCGNIVYEKTQQ